jgi:hypothetical protein
MIDLILGAFFGAGVALVLVEVFGKYPSADEHQELRDDLAEAAVDYCEHKHLNRMESFQAAKWQRYVSLRAELVALTQDDGPKPIMDTVTAVYKHIRKGDES